MSWSKKAAVCGFLSAASCGHVRVMSGTAAGVVPGAPSAAFAEGDGVRIAADGNDWTARPGDLPEHLTPVKVRIVNHSGKPLVLLYERFSLAGRHGHTYRALPLIPLDAPTSVGTVLPIYAADRFFVGPRLQEVYPSLLPWSEPLPRNQQLYEREYHRWSENLPTPEMRRMALPEGVLADGGQISGFLYFENATAAEKSFVFTASLQDGEDGTPVTSIEIPFRVQ
jgi:hypothetical protein